MDTAIVTNCADARVFTSRNTKTLSVGRAASQLGVSEGAVRQLCERGLLKHQLIAWGQTNAIRIDPGDLDTWRIREQEYFSPAVAAKAIGASRTTVKRWIARGLPAEQRGELRKIHLPTLLQWMVENVPAWGTPQQRFCRAAPQIPDNRPGVIYAIRHPHSGEIRYIGKTHDFRGRKQGHLSELRKGNHGNAHLQRWANKLRQPPTITVIQECLPGMMDACEKEWIARGRAKGWRLCNQLEGGVGGPLSDTTRQRLREISKARWSTPEYQERHEAFRARRKGMTVDEYRQWQVGHKAKATCQYGPYRAAWVRAVAEQNKRAVAEQNREVFSTITPLTSRGVAFLPLTNGKWAQVDADDWPRVSEHRWSANQKLGRLTWRAKSNTAPGYLLNRFIMQPGAKECVRHVNGNQLDCRRANLSTRTYGPGHSAPRTPLERRLHRLGQCLAA